MQAYPIRFTPILKEKIWGGTKLQKLLNKSTNAENIGESWEVSGVKGSLSVIQNGPLAGKDLQQVLQEYGAELLGQRNFDRFDTEFPLLIKFIDAQHDLSVQLHPGDDIARERHGSFGKTEMWYVLQADDNAEINLGFKRTIDRSEYLDHLKKGKITRLLHFEKVYKGDAFFIDTGKVHAIGAGILLAEIQQTSDITYRIYDWDRVDAQGSRRELHTDLALDAIDFEKNERFRLSYEKKTNQSRPIAQCQYFTTNFLPVYGSLRKDLSGLDSFVIYLCVGGKAEIQTGGVSEPIRMGETLLIPACAEEVHVNSQSADLLEVYVE